MPLSLKTAVAVLAFQVLANTAVGVLLFVFAAEDIEHGRDVPTLTYVLAVASLAIGVTLLACAVLFVRRSPLARPIVTVLEIFGMISGLIGIVYGAPQAVVGLVLSFLVLLHVYRPESTEWLTASPDTWEDVATVD